MLLLRKSVSVLALTTLLLICATGSTAAPDVPSVPVMERAATPDSVLVSAQLLRDSAQRIDEADLRIMLLENRLAERDSLMASQVVEWSERVEYWRQYAERTSSGWFDKLVYAVVLGAGVWLGVEAGD